MNKEDLEKQYDRFITQLRVEVDQTFWLYNFFFAADSALLGAVFLQHLEGSNFLIAAIGGLVFSIYWKHVMDWKNKWRECWLRRIRIIEEDDLVKIPEKFQMWPELREIGPRRGLWKFLFLLPFSFAIVWAIMLVLYLVGIGVINPRLLFSL